MADKSIMSYETVALDDEKSALVILDQTKLPYEVEILSLTDQKDIWNAIYLLQVRGAPAIGVAAGFGVYLAAKLIQSGLLVLTAGPGLRITTDLDGNILGTARYLPDADPAQVTPQ